VLSCYKTSKPTALLFGGHFLREIASLRLQSTASRQCSLCCNLQCSLIITEPGSQASVRSSIVQHNLSAYTTNPPCIPGSWRAVVLFFLKKYVIFFHRPSFIVPLAFCSASCLRQSPSSSDSCLRYITHALLSYSSVAALPSADTLLPAPAVAALLNAAGSEDSRPFPYRQPRQKNTRFCCYNCRRFTTHTCRQRASF
jgi:hypothetical protein